MRILHCNDSNNDEVMTADTKYGDDGLPLIARPLMVLLAVMMLILATFLQF